MRKILAFTLLSLLAPLHFAQAQTPVEGGIYANTTWSLANSPYIMTGPVVVFPGKTLTIEPGVEVRVEYDGVPNTGMMHYLEIRGSLVAVGTPTARIVFKSDTLPTEFTWLGINVKATQGGNIAMDYFEMHNSFNGIYADQQGAPTWDIHNSLFTYNNYGVQPFGPINFIDCVFQNNGQGIGSGWQVNHNITLKRCLFANNTSCNGFQSYLSADSCVYADNMNGIWYSEGPVTNCRFERNTYAMYGITGSVTNCSFIDNAQALMGFIGSASNCTFSGNGVAAEVSGGGAVTDSEFLNDSVAIAYASDLTASSVVPNVRLNRICGSTRYYVENRSDVNFALDQNCFCETDSTIIEGLIFDGYDDFTRGLFNYAIYDSTCQNVIQYVQKVVLPTSNRPEYSEAQFSLHPVPATDHIRLSLPADALGTAWTATLHDLQGRQIGQARSLDAPTTQWDIAELPSGMYLMRVSGPKSVVMRFSK